MSRFLSSLFHRVVPAEPKKPQEVVVLKNHEEGNDNTDVPSETFFVTPRLGVCPFPTEELQSHLVCYFNTQFGKKYMIWNLSEYSYDSDLFAGQSIDFIFVGYPNPPLLVLFSIFNSVRRWLDSDPDNIALFHCQSTKARSYMFLACYLTWVHEFEYVMDAFRKVCQICRQSVELLPSQVRYMKYVQEIISHGGNKTRKIRIHKIILDGIPVIEEQGTAVRPYIQVFSNSELVFNSYSKDLPPLSYYASDNSIIFDLDLEIEGDVLLRCRHLPKNNKPLTIFRAMFHTCFTKDMVIRFSKNELDGAFNDDRFPSTFNLDFILTDNLENPESTFQQSIVLTPKKNNHNDVEEAKEEIRTIDESDEELDDYFKKLEGK